MIAEIVFNRIREGKPYNSRLKLYSKEYIKKIILELEKEEEYEKCHILMEYLKKRFNHSTNYKNPII